MRRMFRTIASLHSRRRCRHVERVIADLEGQVPQRILAWRQPTGVECPIHTELVMRRSAENSSRAGYATDMDITDLLVFKPTHQRNPVAVGSSIGRLIRTS